MKVTVRMLDENDIEIVKEEFLAIRFKNSALSPVLKQIVDIEKRNRILMPTGNWTTITFTMKKVV